VQVIEQGGAVASFDKIAVGDLTSCGIRSSGRVACWGGNVYHQLGATAPDESRRVFTDVPQIDGASSIAVGSSHACVLTAAGAVWCWGNNTDGVLGDAGPSAPVQVVPSGAKKLAASGSHACVITGDARVLCWGYNRSAALGLGFAGGSRSIPGPPKWR
jgi:alpha-tubulin suppressor-like RCC1 family protein